MLSTELKAGGSIALVRVVKRCIGKVCGFLVHPIVEEQTRINVQQANYLRGVTEQMNRLTEENIRIQKELAELRERLLS